MHTKFQIRSSERKKPPGRPRHRWEDNINMDLEETRCEGMDSFMLQRVGSSGELLWTW